ALHRESPPAVRLSSGGPHFVPSTRSWGFKLAFSSTDDLLNNGTTGRQIYVFNQFNYDCQRGVIPPIQAPCPNPPVPSLHQITTATDGDSVRPSMNEHAQIITFESTASLKGAGSGVPQVFAFLRTAVQRVPANVVLQITNGTGPSTRPMMNAFSRLVFQSTS